MSENTEDTPIDKRLLNLREPWKKGETGNPTGRPLGSRNVKTILTELLDITEEARNPITGETAEVTQLDMILAKLVVQAKHGDMASVDRVLDRFEGKPVQPNKNENDNKNLNVELTELEAVDDEKILKAREVLFGK